MNCWVQQLMVIFQFGTLIGVLKTEGRIEAGKIKFALTII